MIKLHSSCEAFPHVFDGTILLFGSHLSPHALSLPRTLVPAFLRSLVPHALPLYFCLSVSPRHTALCLFVLPTIFKLRLSFYTSQTPL